MHAYLVFFQRGANVPLVALLVAIELALSRLVKLDISTPLPWPVHAQAFLELISVC